jgi:cellulose synthase/poly-beta-1,6-N-acetylglucosamine synthase-like glycosyltransferase
MESLSWLPLGLIGLLSWSVWFTRRFLSHHHYREVVNDFRCSTSLVVPVSREDPDVLERCLRTWLAESPDEIILVIDDQDLLLLGRLHDLALPTVRIVAWRHAGKRDALGAGVRLAEGEVIVFCDSDTSWRPGLLAALQMLFVDPRVGGVGSRQHVFLPDSDPRRPVAYWVLNTRYLDYVRPCREAAGWPACRGGPPRTGGR